MAETIKLRSSDSDMFSVSQDVALCVPSQLAGSLSSPELTRRVFPRRAA